MMMHKSLLLLDYGGVLADHHQEPAESELAAILHVDVPTCRRLLSEKSDLGRAFREDRMTESEFWHAVATRAGADIVALPAQHVLSRLWAETYRLNQRVMELLLQCRSQTYIGVLTNVDRARGAYLEQTLHLPERLDIYLPSYRFRAIKPAAELWQGADAAVHALLGTVRTYYCDDRTTHVNACMTVGWRGVLYENPTQLYEWLKAQQFITNEVRV